MGRKLLNLLTLVAFTFCTGVTLVFYLFFYYGRGLPEYEHLRDYEPVALNRMYTAQGETLYEYAQEKRIFVPLHSIPEPIIQAFLAAEDKNFYYHFGIDFLGIARAVLTNTLTGNWQDHPVGASTITQQVAKNFLLSNERSFARKAREAILAIRLEYTLPKDRILELYLNQIYLGSGAYGIAAAGLIYFDKDLEDLTVEEAAFLAALPKAPSGLLAKGNLDRIKMRRDWVLDRMVAAQMLSEEEATTAKEHPIELKHHRSRVVQADYFVDEIRRNIPEFLHGEAYCRGGLSIKTTIEPELQELADEALRSGLIAYDRRHGWRGALAHIEWHQSQWLDALKQVPKPPGLGQWTYGVILEVTAGKATIGLINGQSGNISYQEARWASSWQPQQRVGPEPKSMLEIVRPGDVVIVSHHGGKRYQLEQIPEITGAIVVIEPGSGRVLALSGGYDFERNQFNCATQAKRQPGSAFKPFVYLAALERGFSPDTIILDAPIEVSLGRGLGVYRPQNYSRRFYGPSPLRLGIEQSRNVMTIRLAQRVGMKNIESIAKKFGVTSSLPRQLAMALGAGETTVLKLTAAYAMLANGGYRVTPHLIDSIQDRYGNTLYQAQDFPEKIASSSAIQNIISMLRGAVERGTAKRLKNLDFPVAGKTGTTNNYKDAWFVGFSPDLVVGVFVGFPTPRTLGAGETGSRVAIPIFEHFMKKAYEKRPKLPFPLLNGDLKQPPSLVHTRSDVHEGFQMPRDEVSLIPIHHE
jgi:penicillin-binding protein 1A